MKQRITRTQVNSLSKKQLDRYCDYCDKKEIGSEVSPRMNIGEMIEFLGKDWWKDLFTWDYGEVNHFDQFEDIELCDALWEALKEVLNGKKGET